MLGYFYLDLLPRDGKFQTAAVFPLMRRAKIYDKVYPSACAMVTNFEPNYEDEPVLLHHHQVKTFFHEFGHVMHNICSEANFTSFSGTAVERDFVEMPS